MSLESFLQAKLLLAAPTRLPALRLFRRNVGAMRMPDESVVRFAIPGQCDLYAITRGGMHLEIELKSEKGTLSPEQKQWAAWCEGWNVPHLVLRSKKLEDADVTVERWCEEIRTLIVEATR